MARGLSKWFLYFLCTNVEARWLLWWKRHLFFRVFGCPPPPSSGGGGGGSCWHMKWRCVVRALENISHSRVVSVDEKCVLAKGDYWQLCVQQSCWVHLFRIAKKKKRTPYYLFTEIVRKKKRNAVNDCSCRNMAKRIISVTIKFAQMPASSPNERVADPHCVPNVSQ